MSDEPKKPSSNRGITWPKAAVVAAGTFVAGYGVRSCEEHQNDLPVAREHQDMAKVFGVHAESKEATSSTGIKSNVLTLTLFADTEPAKHIVQPIEINRDTNEIIISYNDSTPPYSVKIADADSIDLSRVEIEVVGTPGITRKFPVRIINESPADRYLEVALTKVPAVSDENAISQFRREALTVDTGPRVSPLISARPIMLDIDVTRAVAGNTTLQTREVNGGFFIAGLTPEQLEALSTTWLNRSLKNGRFLLKAAAGPHLTLDANRPGAYIQCPELQDYLSQRDESQMGR